MNSLTNRLLFVSKTLRKSNLYTIANRCYSSKLKNIIAAIPKSKIDGRDSRGWTALMLAAKEGDSEATELLLEKGATAAVMTNSGHSAYDIAVFWRSAECAKILEPPGMGDLGPNFFVFDGFKRNGKQREKLDWIEKTVIEETSEFILMYKAEPVITFDEKLNPKARARAPPQLLIKPYHEIHHLIAEDFKNVVYLGQWDHEFTERKKGEKVKERNIFAVDISNIERSELKEIYPGTEILAAFPGLLRLPNHHAGVVGQARSLLDWSSRYQHCASCGAKTSTVNAGYKHVCSNKECITHKQEGKDNINHPRVDPTVVTAVMARDNQHCLLARQKVFPVGMYSCLAGFVEPGESIEQACSREVLEEVGLSVQSVTYHSSQPWPMPSTLMIGCTAYIDHNIHIEMDTEELEDARWFERSEVVSMLLQIHPDGLFLPPRQAIAHRLLHHWLYTTAFNP